MSPGNLYFRFFTASRVSAESEARRVCVEERPGRGRTGLARGCGQHGADGADGGIEGIRCVPSVSALPEAPDLVLVAVPAAPADRARRPAPGRHRCAA